MNDFERKGNQHRVKTYAIVHVLRVTGKESLGGTANPLFLRGQNGIGGFLKRLNAA